MELSNGWIFTIPFLDKRKDVYQYQGHAYTYVGWDELTQWPDDFAYNYLFSRVRSAKGAPCYIRATSNPGGVGDGWGRCRVIGPAPAMTPIREIGYDNDGKEVERMRVFIPAKLADNQILMKADPMYMDRLDQLSDPVLRSALKDGNWDVFSGQAFTEWDHDIHVTESRMAPEGVTMWRSCDWGYEKPYCVLWFYADYDGNITVFNEIYGDGGKSNQGSREPASVVREKIEAFEAENNLWVPIGYLDPQCWAAHDSGPSIAENLGGTHLNWQPWSKGPNSRRIQKQVVHDHLKVVNGKSRLRIMDRCTNLIRTMPSLPLSERDHEDIDTDSEDHAYDTLRGGLVKKVLTRDERRRVHNLRQKVRRKRIRYTGTYGGY